MLYQEFGQDFEHLTIAGQAAHGSVLNVEENIGQKLQQLETDLMNANKLLEEHNKQKRNNENWAEQVGQSVKLALARNVAKITCEIETLKNQRQIELQKTLKEILQKQKPAIKITKGKKRKASIGILSSKEDKLINKKIRWVLSTSASTDSTNESDAFQAVVQNPLIGNMRRQLPPELLNEIYKNLPITIQFRMLTVNFSTNALLGGPNVVKKKWLKWKEVFFSIMYNCRSEMANLWPLLDYWGFGAFMKRKIQIEWHSYKDCLDEAIVWFYNHRKKQSFRNKNTQMKCFQQRKNRLDAFKKTFAEEKAMLEFWEKICSLQFECTEKLEKQLRRIRVGLPELIRIRKVQFDLVKAEVGNRLELADDLYAKLKKAEQERIMGRIAVYQMRQMLGESERKKSLFNCAPNFITCG